MNEMTFDKFDKLPAEDKRNPEAILSQDTELEEIEQRDDESWDEYLDRLTDLDF